MNIYVVARNVNGLEKGVYHYLVITANYPKVAQKFKGETVKQMALQESGHVGQNLYLQA